MAAYRIRVEGELGPEWAEWLDATSITREGGGLSLLSCAIEDQAALHGLLRKVRDLGLVLVSVERTEYR